MGQGLAGSATASWGDSVKPSSCKQWNELCISLQICATENSTPEWSMHVFYKRQGSKTAMMFPGFSVQSSCSPYATCLVSVSAVIQEIPEKDFELFFSLPQQILIAVSLRSPEGISKGGHDCVPSANLLALHNTDVRLPAQSVKCSSLEKYSKENKISNLLSAINFQEDWSCGTQRENSNLTPG